ncbi:hypothetical protein [Deinococcus arenicola]|uniref:Uncharacterized protein n=1 Tax=Deinococcus arenicola TaxID=2994950 RepID=A0ABU4DTG5_9DEIO|nr:hypothetical protein [Deinococcus sp. ZS9-10]MDV6375722.1 hypothetical protein [Deinococcus sp. ZS9-10]
MIHAAGSVTGGTFNQTGAFQVRATAVGADTALSRIVALVQNAQASADVGIAIGAGTDVAVETADVVLVRSDPASVAGAITLARQVRGKIKQNLFWAAGYNLLAIPFAAGVLYPSLGILLRPEWAALLMSASTVIVTLNALSLNRVKFARATTPTSAQSAPS